MAGETTQARSGRRRLLDPSARAIGIVSFTVSALTGCTPPAPTANDQPAGDVVTSPASTNSAPTNHAASHRQGTVAERVRAIIVDHIGVPAGRLADTAAIPGDSLDKVELVMAIEEEFGIEIPDDEAERLATVGDLIAYVERNATR